MVADGLNQMLSQLEQASDILQQRVREATSELLLRNAELEESYQRVLGLQEALARAERMAAVGEMAASVAHQVGTPLNLVSGYVQMIREDPSTQTVVRQRLEIVEAQIRRSRACCGRCSTRRGSRRRASTTRLGPLVERACTIARPRLVASGVQLEVRLDDDSAGGRRERPQLELALLNLVTNALDAMPGGGTLSHSRHRRPKAASGSRSPTRARHSPPTPAAPVRAVGDDQAGRPGHGSRAGHRPRRGRGARRRDPRRQPARLAAPCSRSICRAAGTIRCLPSPARA